MFEIIQSFLQMTMTEENSYINKLVNSNWLSPDPAWDYTTIYERLQISKSQLDNLIEMLSEIESASPQSDRVIRDEIDAIGRFLNQTRRLLDE